MRFPGPRDSSPLRAILLFSGDGQNLVAYDAGDWEAALAQPYWDRRECSRNLFA